MFLQVSVCQQGGCACHMTGGHAWWWGGVHAQGGHVCLGGMCGWGECMARGVLGCGGVCPEGACMARGHAWLGACMLGGMHSQGAMAEGHAWLGHACWGGMRGWGLGLGAWMPGGMCAMPPSLILQDTFGQWVGGTHSTGMHSCTTINQTQKKNSFLQGSVFSLYLHDAVYMYALATDELFKEGGYKRNGSRIFEIAKNKTFEGKTTLEQIFLILLKFTIFRKRLKVFTLPPPPKLTFHNVLWYSHLNLQCFFFLNLALANLGSQLSLISCVFGKLWQYMSLTPIPRGLQNPGPVSVSIWHPWDPRLEMQILFNQPTLHKKTMVYW